MSYGYAGPGARREYIPRAHAACAAGGCQFAAAQEIVATAEQIAAQMGRSGMSQALWCDQGGHAFSERDPGRKRISMDTLDDDSGDLVKESRDFCGECAVKSGLTGARKTRPAAALTGFPSGSPSGSPPGAGEPDDRDVMQPLL